MKAMTYLIINWYQRSRTADHRPYVTLACEHGGEVKIYTKPIVDNEEEEIPVKRREPYRPKNAGKLTEEQLQQTEQFRKSRVSPRNILQFFREQDVGCAVRAQKIYNVVAKIKKNRMQGRNTLEEVLCLSAQRGYIVFYRNRVESNVLNDVVAHPTSIAMIRTWSYVLIMDTTYKTNKETGLMLGIDDMFRNPYHMLYRRHIDQNMLAKLTGMVKGEEVAKQFVNGSCNKLINEIDKEECQRKLEVLKSKWQSRPDFLHYLFSTWLNPFVHKFCRVWTFQVLHFEVETTNHAESEHSVLKLWLSTCRGDLDTMFLNIDSLIEDQIAIIKYSLKISKLKEKFVAKSNVMLKSISNKISHLALKKI
ncbi:hypothetical protein M9H77_07824 [Catharanthus roseus]|uniref:Uncharacterized protein n=1 Tax=Catharanthus roseus TaxID=4058 RepID=A0ACC0BWB9_CATRO|nr:hypothetical protein M9H77_07824 [Catharanthus roseus]